VNREVIEPRRAVADDPVALEGDDHATRVAGHPVHGPDHARPVDAGGPVDWKGSVDDVHHGRLVAGAEQTDRPGSASDHPELG
jgi:hypothetical protein